MKEKTINLIIAVLPMLDAKLGQVKNLVKDTINAANPISVTLDLTDVDPYSWPRTVNEIYLELIAEALQEVGICNPKLTAGEECRFKGAAVKKFRRILKLLDERTVRIAFGEQFVRELDDDLTPEQAKDLLDKSDGGCVRLLRFRTPAEKQAYLLGINDADGWLDYATLDNLNATISKASRTLPVEPV